MATNDNRPAGSDSPLTFEQALAELEAVVRILEDGHVGLDESLVKYEQGVKLLQVCRDSLQKAERKIMLLTGLDADGNPIVQTFSEETGTLEEKREARTRRRSRTPKPTAPCDEVADDSNGADDASVLDRQKGLF